MEAITEIERLKRRKRRALRRVWLGTVALLAGLALRFVPFLNDYVSGKPEYVRALTDSIARQIVVQSDRQFPVIVEKNESGRWPGVKQPALPEEDYRGILYILTYSEKERLTCVTRYAIPADASKFSNVYTITPEQGKNYGPALLRPLKAVPVSSQIHVYPPAYLKTLNWRYQPHFPLSPSEAATLASRSYYSGDQGPDQYGDIEIDYAEVRAEVATRHELVNLCIVYGLLGCVALACAGVVSLIAVYRASLQYSGLHGVDLTARAFLSKNFATRVAAAEKQWIAAQEAHREQLRQEERLQLLRVGWEASLRSALPGSQDEQLRLRVQECLDAKSPDVDLMEALWMELQEQAGQKTPAEKLRALLESIRPYCGQEEFEKCQAEAFAVLNESGFRSARKFATTMHEEFKRRAREVAETEERELRKDSEA